MTCNRLNSEVVNERDSKEVSTGIAVHLILCVSAVGGGELWVDIGLEVVDGGVAGCGGKDVFSKVSKGALLLDGSKSKELACGDGASHDGVLGRVGVWCPVDLTGQGLVDGVVVDEDGHAQDVHRHAGWEDE